VVDKISTCNKVVHINIPSLQDCAIVRLPSQRITVYKVCEVEHTKKMTSGFPTSAIAVDNLRLLPPDRSQARLLECSTKPSRSVIFSTTYTYKQHCGVLSLTHTFHGHFPRMISVN